MIFRDNKSRDCGINEVTAYKGRDGSGSHRSAPPETGDRRISNSSYRRSSRRGTNCFTGIPFSTSPLPPSPVASFRYSSRCNFSALDNKLFDRELSIVIRPPISHAIRFIGNVYGGIENKYENDRISPCGFIIRTKSDEIILHSTPMILLYFSYILLSYTCIIVYWRFVRVKFMI